MLQEPCASDALCTIYTQAQSRAPLVEHDWQDLAALKLECNSALTRMWRPDCWLRLIPD